MDNAKWIMQIGKWKIENWKMENGKLEDV